MVNKMQIIFNPIQAQTFRYDYFMKRKQEKENKLREIYNYISDNNLQKKNSKISKKFFWSKKKKIIRMFNLRRSNVSSGIN